MPRVNLEGASLIGCSMDERLGIHTNLEGEIVCVCTFGKSMGREDLKEENIFNASQFHRSQSESYNF